MAWKQKAYQDIVDKLNRVPFVETAAVKKGREFEDAVERVAKAASLGGELKGSENFRRVVHKCMGGVWQTWQRGSVFVSNDYPLVDSVGRLDVLFPEGHRDYANGHIIDLKTTANFRGSEKYEKGWQHKFYCHWMQIPTFDYVVAEWCSGEYDCKDIKEIHTVSCKVDLERTLSEISDGLLTFFAFLKSHNIWDDYVYSYCKNKR